jgi:hypothetical protein
MRLEERRTIVFVLAAGVIGAVLFMPAVYFFGLWLAPPRPVPEARPAPALLREAIWARADGGPATELRPINPLNFVQHRVCRALAARQDDPKVRGERRAECLKQLPAIQGIDYLSGVHMRDHDVPPGFRESISQFATAVWLTRSWTKESFLDTLAARGDFGYGWRGVDAAARGYFGRESAELTLPQAAVLAAFVGDRGTDPWCDPESATGMRNRILDRMRENGVIDEAALDAARSSPFELTAPPPAHRCPS